MEHSIVKTDNVYFSDWNEMQAVFQRTRYADAFPQLLVFPFNDRYFALVVWKHARALLFDPCVGHRPRGAPSCLDRSADLRNEIFDPKNMRVVRPTVPVLLSFCFFYNPANRDGFTMGKR